MGIVLLITFLYGVAVWLVFFKFKWLRFSPAWGVVSVFFGVHLFLIFILGLRFVTPYSSNAKIVQHTIQLIPRLPEPILLTAVLVAPDAPVKKGQPLFQFDRRPYEPQGQATGGGDQGSRRRSPNPQTHGNRRGT
jgi:multidrug resistance efflux pump